MSAILSQCLVLHKNHQNLGSLPEHRTHKSSTLDFMSAIICITYGSAMRLYNVLQPFSAAAVPVGPMQYWLKIRSFNKAVLFNCRLTMAYPP